MLIKHCTSFHVSFQQNLWHRTTELFLTEMLDSNSLVMVYNCCHTLDYDCKGVVSENVCFITDFVHVIKCEKERNKNGEKCFQFLNSYILNGAYLLEVF